MGAQLPLLPLFPASHKLAVEISPRRERQPGTCKRCKLSFNSGNLRVGDSKFPLRVCSRA